jgi:hypothetical protein
MGLYFPIAEICAGEAHIKHVFTSMRSNWEVMECLVRTEGHANSSNSSNFELRGLLLFLNL